MRVTRIVFAQYADAIRIEFREKGKRKMYYFLEDSRPSTVILLGWGHMDVREMYEKHKELGNIGEGVTAYVTRHISGDKKWDNEFEKDFEKYLNTVPLVQILLDLRGETISNRLDHSKNNFDLVEVILNEFGEDIRMRPNLSKDREKPYVFVSYFHDGNIKDREDFEKKYKYKINSTSIYPGEIDPSRKDYLIRREIRDRIAKCNMLIVLIGKCSYSRKWIDWEIRAALDRKNAGGAKMVIGILLPEIQKHSNEIIDIIARITKQYSSNVMQTTEIISKTLLNKFNFSLPNRFIDNLQTGYSELFTWKEFEKRFDYIIELKKPTNFIMNNRKMLKDNL